MPIFQRYLLKEMLLNAVVTFGVILMIFTVGGTLQALHKSDFLTVGLFLRFVGFFVGTRLGEILPMTVLVAVMFTYGRAAAENEINALRAAGVHLITPMAPGFLFGLIATAVVFHVNDRIASQLEFTSSVASEADLAAALDAVKDKSDKKLELSNKEQLLWASIDPENGYFRELRYKKYTKETGEGAVPLEQVIKAEYGRIRYDARQGLAYLDMYGVVSLFGENKGLAIGDMTNLPITPPGTEVREKKLRHYSLAELQEAKARDYEGRPKRRAIAAEYHQRIAGSFACFLFTLVGIPLAIIFRQGNRLVAFLLAFMIALVVYYPTFILGEVLAKETDINPILSIWSGSLVLLSLGLGLSFVVMRR